MNSEVRKKMVVIRMNNGEYERLESLVKKSTCGSVSEYLRNVGLAKPVVIKHRNQSADEILSVLLQIKKELSAVGNNLNQAVHKLHTLDKIPEFRTWIMLHETTRQTVEKKAEEIKLRMNQIYQQWSQK